MQVSLAQTPSVMSSAMRLATLVTASPLAAPSRSLRSGACPVRVALAPTPSAILLAVSVVRRSAMSLMSLESPPRRSAPGWEVGFWKESWVWDILGWKGLAMMCAVGMMALPADLSPRFVSGSASRPEC